jgi:hypothetical protein
MSDNFILERNNFLSKEECNILIKDLKGKVKPPEKEEYGYESCDLEGTPIFNQIQHRVSPLWGEYINAFPEVNLTPNKWSLTYIRFKKFKPGKSFEYWHSEHSYSHCTRVLNIQLYLSTHDCGTEFYNGDVVKSEIGKVVIFPSYFTHTHKGQKCPDNKTRYLITGYVNFLNL